ncbi:MAG: penicillin-binding protein 2 [Peptococcaceae bacterium]|jgi:penicillin-binding protein 2|nr:penicillin-binding protein 2 [Peptococcaceae bacterium]
MIANNGITTANHEEEIRLLMKNSLHLYLGAIILIFALLVSRVAWLQLLNQDYYQNQSEHQATRWIPEQAPRGEIVDRNGSVLISNRPVYNLTLNYLGLKDQDMEAVISQLVELVRDPAITEDSIKEMIATQNNRLFEPIVIKRDISLELLTQLEERRRELPGVMIETSPQRSYQYGTLASHLLGYVHSVTKEELEQPEYSEYGLADLIGKTGVEKRYESELRGENGYRQVEVTASNRPVREIMYSPSMVGDRIELTIDAGLQRTMETAFDETLIEVQEKNPKAQAGAAVLLDVKNGGVLAMVSRPDLNPADFNGKSLTQAQADYYFSVEPPALRNRAIQGSYVPGSTFKPITAMAALASGKVKPEDTVVCTGRYWNKPYIQCTGVHGRVNMYQAMAKSCNVYFQEIARRTGIAMIGEVGNEFGLSAPTGVDLPYENTGLLPSLEWQQKEFEKRAEGINAQIDAKIEEFNNEYQPQIDRAESDAERSRLERELRDKVRVWESERASQLEHYTNWHEFDTYNTGIGQGYNQYTVMQLAAYTSAIANEGLYQTPYVVRRVVASDGTVVEETAPQTRQVAVPADVIKEVKQSILTVTQPGGTAWSLFRHFPPEIKVGAKTGTAQPGRPGYVKNKDFDGVFIAFAPADDPQIAFAGVMEFGQGGTVSIGLVAKKVFETYFNVAPQAAAPVTVREIPLTDETPAADGQASEDLSDTPDLTGLTGLTDEAGTLPAEDDWSGQAGESGQSGEFAEDGWERMAGEQPAEDEWGAGEQTPQYMPDELPAEFRDPGE